MQAYSDAHYPSDDWTTVSTAISRMQFLRGDFSGRGLPLRPPWALAEQSFTSLCDRCGHCIDVCPTQILQSGRGGFPVVDFSAGECLFCEECLDVCKPGALEKAVGGQPWSLKASIDSETCIAFNGVECRSCQDPCEPRAIRMPPVAGGVAIPDIDINLCTGCGACYAVCPVRAVRIQPATVQE